MTRLRAQTKREAIIEIQTEKRAALNTAITGLVLLLMSLIPALHDGFSETGRTLLTFGIILYIILHFIRRPK